ncbi:MAG: hypothetical protein JNJ84_04400 [Rhodobacteraceae bacterium]|nr:hypothetical protein [Paracoccaceae bacterium]
MGNLPIPRASLRKEPCREPVLGADGYPRLAPTKSALSPARALESRWRLSSARLQG